MTRVNIIVYLSGLALAAIVGIAAVARQHVSSALPRPEGNGGMTGFGDVLLAVGVFGLASQVPAGLAL